MNRWLSKLTLNQKLGALALALGAVAVFAEVAPGRTVTVNAKDLLTSVERRQDHVTPSELAAWIIEGRGDYRLIDLRDEKAYAAYHIPTAENIPLAKVVDGALGRTEKVVLYGDGGVNSAVEPQVGLRFSVVRSRSRNKLRRTPLTNPPTLPTAWALASRTASWTAA